MQCKDVDLQVCILGAGVVGLTTALKLQEMFNNKIKCTIIAESFSIDTTSHGAAGIFRPSPSFTLATPELSTKCISDSYYYYRDLLNKDCGVSEISGYIFSNTDPALVRNHYLERLVPVYRQVSEDELSFCPGEWKFGSYFSTLLIECKFYLPWAMSKFQERGGIISKERIHNLSDLDKFGRFDVLLNCSGLGAKKLFDDKRIVPIRGQILKVNAPWLKKFCYGDFDTYVIPCSGGFATLGGTRNYESWNTHVCKYDTASIWERCTKLVPKLKDNCEIISQWVGLRPHRDCGVRIQAQIVNGLKVVHNYGHGGYGVTSAPGTADQAIELVMQFVKLRTTKL